MRRDRGWDRDRPRDRDRDRDRERDRSRERDRGRVSRMRPEPSPLRKPASESGLRHSSGGGSAPPPSRHLWVGNLASTVSEKMLFEEFQRFGDVESLNHLPGRSYAFVNFSREQDAVRALRALQGIRFDGSPIKIEFSKGDMEPSDILWIGFPANLNVDETALRTVFSPFGEIIRIATFPGRSYAFVHYRDVASASRARESLNGKLFNNPRVHISFARSDAFNDAAGSGGARRSSPRRLDRDPDFEGYRRDFHSRPMSPRDKTTSDWSHNEPIRRGRGNIHFDEDHEPSFQRRQRLDYDEPHPLPAPFDRRQVSYSDDPYPLQLPPYERRRGPYPDDSHILPPPVNHRQGPDDYYPLKKRMRVSPDTIGDPESELPEYPFDELLHRPTRLSQLNEGSSAIRAGPGGGGVIDISMGKFSISNTKILKEVWKWEGVIAKGGATVCQARCFPVGKTLDFMLPEILNCSARTNLEMLSREYYQAAASWVVFFAPRSDADIASYNDFMHYLNEKQRVAVAKLKEKVSLFLVPPSEFTEKVLKVPGKLSISGLVLRFNQQMDTDQDPGSTFNQPASKPGRIIEDSLVSRTHSSPDFRSHVGPSSGNFTSGNISSSFTPPYIPPNSIQQQNHGSSALGLVPQPPINPIQQQIQGPGSSGFVPPQPNPVQQQMHEVGASGFAPQLPTNPLQQQNLEQGYANFQRPLPTNALQQQNLELGPTSFQRQPPHNTLKQQNLERSPIGFPHPLPPNSTQQNPEPYNSGFPQQPPSNPTWQQTQQPLVAGGYNPVQNNSFSGNVQLRPDFTPNYMAAPPPLPPGPPPPRAGVPPSIPQPASMPFQFGINYTNYEQGVQEQIHNQNPNPNVSPVMNSMSQPSYNSQAPPVQEQIQNQNLNPNPNSNVNLMMSNIPQPSYTTQAPPMQEQLQNQNPNPYPNPNLNSNMDPMTNSMPPPSYTSQASMPPAFWGPSVGQVVASVPPAVQQQQQQQQQAGGGSGGAGSNNAMDPDRQKRLEATMQLAAVLLQQMQQQANSGTDKQ